MGYTSCSYQVSQGRDLHDGYDTRDACTRRSVDSIITPGWVFPVAPPGQLLSDCSIVVDEGRIIALLPTAEAQRQFQGEREFKLPQSLVMPGLINTHGHAAMTLLRGFADDLALEAWLNERIWPAESRWVGEDFVREGTELAVAEMLLSGITTCSDMYFFPDQVTRVMRQSGMRCQIAFPILEFASNWARDADEYIHKGLALHDECRDEALVDIAFGPHAPYTVSDDTFTKLLALAGELDAHVHIHVHETAGEVANALAETGRRPLQRLYELGGLSSTTQCVHMTQIDDTDIRLLQQTGAHVVHCPQSNLKLGSGICPVANLAEAGINVALGTDGAASNNTLNLFSAMNFASLLAKGLSGNAQAVGIEDALAMATLNGARALGLDREIGSIETGKRADLAAVDLSSITSQPLYNPLSQLVYTDCAPLVSHVWVDGRLLVENRALKTLDTAAVLRRAGQWRSKIIGS
ncbi:MAG TPA: TRZ/ATZ family hydrolase [Porticoccaceae bacterium]|nr:TRZ/ATZ family hydrolase [Porticoccaceae bacterium]